MPLAPCAAIANDDRPVVTTRQDGPVCLKRLKRAKTKLTHV